MTEGELGRSWKSFGGDRGGECGERDAAGNKAWADNVGRATLSWPLTSAMIHEGQLTLAKAYVSVGSQSLL